MTVSEPQFLACALAYAEFYGWSVFPLKPGQKIPDCEHGHTMATTDSGQINTWWSEEPLRGIGVRTGSRTDGGSGFFVVDLDVKMGALGLASWEAFETQHGAAPNTVCATTPSGGKHLLFEQPDTLEVRCSNSKIGYGIDIKANGGYIVVAPTVLRNGVYSWINSRKDTRFAFAPDWLLALVVSPPKRNDVPGLFTETGKIPTGERHSRMLAHAGYCRNLGWTCNAIRGSLHAMNKHLCEVMMPAEEVNDLARDMKRYPPSNTIMRQGQMKQFKPLSVADLKKRPKPKWLVWGLITEKSLVCLFGHPGCYKTFLALDISLSISTGRTFAGRTAMRGSVVYIVAEGADGFAARVDAWEQHHKQSIPDNRAVFIEEPVNITDPAEVGLFLSAIGEMEEAPSLIVIDTLARCFGGQEENDASAMGRFINGCDRIKSEVGCTVLIVHHRGKTGMGPRGSSALHGAVDTLIVAKKIGETVQITNNAAWGGKQKDAREFPVPLKFHASQVDIAPDDDGKARVGMIIKWWNPKKNEEAQGDMLEVDSS